MENACSVRVRRKLAAGLAMSIVALLCVAEFGTRSAAAQEGGLSIGGQRIEILPTPYLWFPWTSIEVKPVRSGLGTRSTTIDPAQLDGHVTWVPFMGAIELRGGPIGVVVDYIHAPLKAGVSTRNILFGGGSSGLTIDTGTAMILYRAVSQPTQYADIGLGVRGWGFAGDISLDQGLLPPVRLSSGLSWADPLIGARYHRNLGGSFGATIIGDFGGFGLGAHVDWQLLGTIDYTLKPGIDLRAGFRSLNFNYDDSSGTGYDVHMYGPVVGATFRF
jgi:hypothetical protein